MRLALAAETTIGGSMQHRAYVVHVAADAGSMRWHEFIIHARDERHAARIAAMRWPNCVRRIMGSPRLDHRTGSEDA